MKIESECSDLTLMLEGRPLSPEGVIDSRIGGIHVDVLDSANLDVWIAAQGLIQSVVGCSDEVLRGTVLPASP